MKRMLGRLRVQFTLYITLLLVAFTVLVLAFNWRGQTEIAIDRLQAHVDYVAELTARLAADLLSEGDQNSLPAIVADIVELEEALSITLLDVDGNEIVSAGGINLAAEIHPVGAEIAPSPATLSEGYLHADAEITVDGARIGVVHIVRTVQTGATTLGGSILGGVAAEEFASVREILVRNTIIGLVVFLFAIPVAALMIWRVTSGITAVTEAAGRIAAGDLEAELPRSGTGEVADLQAAFRTMQSRLRTNIERIETLAYVDTVTRLPNRSRFQILLEEAVASDESDGGALMMIDLDHFQGVNDTLGHTFGDAVLRAVAARIEAVLAGTAAEGRIGKWTLARFGGDEFVVLLLSKTDDTRLQELADAIVGAMDEALIVNGSSIHIGCSVGVAPFHGREDSEEIVQRADLATYAAKHAGRRSARFFTPDLGVTAGRRAALENDLRDAIRAGDLTVYFQPIIDVGSGLIAGAEALVRWPHPKHGFVEPSEFIPIAEESGLIADIGEHVLELSLRSFRRLIEDGHTLTLSVNIAPAQLRREDFADIVGQALERNAFPPHLLELELTETTAMLLSDNPSRPMQRLRGNGVRFAIDDFGTGHSNLARLPRLKFDRLKIDRSFIDCVADNSDNRKIVTAIVTLARSLSLEVVAEGIEREADLMLVRDLGIEFAQGFLWCPALPFDDYAALVNALRPNRQPASTRLSA